MIAMQVVACLGIMAGCFLLFGISLTDFHRKHFLQSFWISCASFKTSS